MNDLSRQMNKESSSSSSSKNKQTREYKRNGQHSQWCHNPNKCLSIAFTPTIWAVLMGLIYLAQHLDVKSSFVALDNFPCLPLQVLEYLVHNAKYTYLFGKRFRHALNQNCF